MIKPKDGAKVIIFSPDKILLFHRDDIPTIPLPDCWQLVGGEIEKGETPKQALLREVKEETSYDLKDYKLISQFTGLKDENVWLYLAFIDKSEESKFILGRDEGQEIGWFTFEKAFELNLTPGTRRILLKYRELIEKE